MAKVFIGVDPHRLSATIKVVDRHERSWRPTGSPRTRLATRRRANTSPGTGTGCGRWSAINGTGRPLAQRLLADGEHVAVRTKNLRVPSAPHTQPHRGGRQAAG